MCDVSVVLPFQTTKQTNDTGRMEMREINTWPVLRRSPRWAMVISGCIRAIGTLEILIILLVLFSSSSSYFFFFLFLFLFVSLISLFLYFFLFFLFLPLLSVTLFLSLFFFFKIHIFDQKCFVLQTRHSAQALAFSFCSLFGPFKMDIKQLVHPGTNATVYDLVSTKFYLDNSQVLYISSFLFLFLL